VLLTVRLHPSSSREHLEARTDGTLEAWVRQRPVEGRANEALIALVAERLGVPRSSVRLVRGATARTKVLEVPLEESGEVRLRLARGK
jgi:uncharacterized protein